MRLRLSLTTPRIGEGCGAVKSGMHASTQTRNCNVNRPWPVRIFRKRSRPRNRCAANRASTRLSPNWWPLIYAKGANIPCSSKESGAAPVLYTWMSMDCCAPMACASDSTNTSPPSVDNSAYAHETTRARARPICRQSAVKVASGAWQTMRVVRPGRSH